MSLTVQSYFDSLIPRVAGLKAVLVTDKDGVNVLKAGAFEFSDKVAEPALASVFTIASENASKVFLGKNNCIMAMYDKYLLVQFAHSSLVIHFIASAEANAGSISSLATEIREVLSTVKDAVEQESH
eukprot:GILI01010255.1.p2 GENE.GILI01010255.1~~GILI01010255.1.p2  ORF type:complete len:136 (-),score=32.30 GILI01010255.1:43-423(-)